MKNPIKNLKNKGLRKEIKKKFVRSKNDLAEAFAPEKINAMKELMQPLIQAITRSRTESQFGVNTQHDLYLYDFEQGAGGFGIIENMPGLTMPPMAVTDAPIQNATPAAIVKPKDVLHELETHPAKIDLKGIDQKINVLNAKKKLIRENSFSTAETIGMITRMENRKKYEHFKTFYDQFQNTTGLAIDTLLSKYKLVLKSSDLFVPEFPDEAINIMTAYTEETEKLCGKKPVFYVIAEAEDFKKKNEKRDPILLAQSPFGIYYQILGAWDKEMILLSEL